MGQLGFFNLNRRYEGLDEKGNPLVAIAAIVPCDSFRGKLKAALIKGELRKNDAERKYWAGRKPWDEVVFKALVLQALYNLSDDQTEYQLRDRFSFTRFLGLGLEDAVFDAKTPWLYREALAKAGAVEELFDLFDGFLKDKGYLAMASAGSKRFSREGKKEKREGRQERADPTPISPIKPEAGQGHPSRSQVRMASGRALRASDSSPQTWPGPPRVSSPSTTSAARANNGSKRASARSNGRVCHAALSPPTRFVFTFMRWPTISALLRT